MYILAHKVAGCKPARLFHVPDASGRRLPHNPAMKARSVVGKNLVRLIEAFAQLVAQSPAEPLALVIAGKRGSYGFPSLAVQSNPFSVGTKF